MLSSIVTGARSNSKSKTFAILQFIAQNGPSTKYDIVTKVLKVNGDRQRLRGYYSDWFQMARNGGLVTIDYSTYQYSLTEKGQRVVDRIQSKTAS